MKTEEFASELDRLDALLKWWGAPTADSAKIPQAHLARFDAIVSELERAVVEISQSQEKTLNQSKDLLIQSIPVFMNGRDLNQVMSAQSKILLSLFDTASAQVKTWVNFADKIRNAQLSLAASGIAADAEAASETDHEAESEKNSAPAVPRRRKTAQSA